MIHNLKPYPAYKDSGVSWLGKVPEHWVVKRLKQCVERFYAGGTPDSGNGEYYCDTSKGLPWLMIADMTHQRHVKSTVKAITEKGQASKNLEVLPKGTLLYSMYASLGTVSVLEIEAAINQAIIGIKTRNLELETEFTLYFLESLQPYITLLSNSSTQANLNAEKVRSLPIYIPPLPEQSAIVHYLDYIDRRIRRYIHAKKKLIKLLEEQKQAIIHQAFTRGLDPNVRLKPSGVQWLGDVPEHWEVIRLKQVTTPIEQGWSPQCDAQQATDDEWGVLKVGCVNRDFFDASQNKKLPSSLNPVPSLEIQDGDILVSRANTRELLGLAALAENPRRKLILCDKLFRFRVLPEYLDSRFLVFAIRNKTSRAQIESSTNGASDSMQNIGQGVIRNLLLSLPPLDEQKLIVTTLANQTEELVVAINRTQREISLLREYRTRLIADVVTGKLDVREAAANLPEETDETEVLEDEFAGDDETAEEELESEPEEE